MLTCTHLVFTLLIQELAIVTDIIIGFVIVSLALGVTMYAQFRMYQRQQKLLEQARADAEAANQAKALFLPV